MIKINSKYVEDITNYNKNNPEIDELEKDKIEKIMKSKKFYRIGYCSKCNEPFNLTSTKIRKEITLCGKCMKKISSKLAGEKRRGKKRSPEIIKKMREGHRRYMQTDKHQEDRELIRKIQKELWQNPEHRKKMETKMTALWKNNEFLFNFFKSRMFGKYYKPTKLDEKLIRIRIRLFKIQQKEVIKNG